MFQQQKYEGERERDKVFRSFQVAFGTPGVLYDSGGLEMRQT